MALKREASLSAFVERARDAIAAADSSVCMGGGQAIAGIVLSGVARRQSAQWRPPEAATANGDVQATRLAAKR